MSTAHVYLQELGPELSHEDVEHLAYDDATQQLLVVKGGHVFAYDISGGPAGHSSLKWMYPLQEGPPVLAMRPSLDNRLLALQRAPAMLELVDLASGLCFVHSTHQGRGEILAFFFTDAPDTDLVVVTTRAVELNQFAAKRQGLRCRERVRLASAWARYSHDTRMVLVGSAVAPRSGLSAWQFASHGIVHIPLFELQGLLPASAAVRQFLPSTAAAAAGSDRHPPPAAAAAAAAAAADRRSSASSILSAAAAAAAGAAPAAWGLDGGLAAVGQGSSALPQVSRVQQGPSGPHRQLNPASLWLLKMYGGVYLAHADGVASRLELYRFYTDTIILEHVLDLFSPEVQLSVVDNTLVVHHPPTAVAVLFDVALHSNRPLANPLPLRRLQLLPPDLAAAAAIELEQQQEAVVVQGAAGAAAAATGDAGSPAGSSEGGSSGSSTFATAAAAAAAGGQRDLEGRGASSSVGSSVRVSSFSSSLSRTRAGFRRTLITVPAAAAAAPGSSGSNAAAVAAAAAAGSAAVFESSEVLEEGGWVFFPPGIVLDKGQNTVGRLQLDLQAVVESAEEWPAVVGFLLRRRALGPTAPLAAEPRALLMQVVRSALQERLGLVVLRGIFDKLLQAYVDAVRRVAYSAPARAAAAAAGHGGSSSAAAAAATAAAAAATAAAGGGGSGSSVGVLDVPAVNILTPNELAQDLFQWVHDEEVVDALYLQAAVSEYCAASEAVGVPPPPYLQLLCVDLLLQQEQHYQAVQLLYSQPGGGSTSLAQHLLEKAGKSTDHRQLGGGVAAAGAAAAAAPGGGAGSASVGSDGPAELSGGGVGAAGVGGRSGGGGGAGVFDAANPTAAMALELALDVMTRQAVPELRPVGPAAAAAAGGGPGATSVQPPAAGAAAAASAAVGKPATAALVRQLLELGEVLQAARIARTAGGVLALGVPPVAFLQAAAARRDLGALAAVYRVMRPHVVGQWPDFEAARQALCGGAGAVVVG